jgi:hypothetical protein
MATTYSSNYQIKLIGTGLEAGTWGRSTNLNFEKLEQAIGGSTEITLDGTLPTGSDWNVVSNTLRLVTNNLVDADESGAEPRSHYIKITNTGTLTAGVTVRFYGDSTTSSTNRVFIVENALSLSGGADDQFGTLTLRSAAGSTGISLPHGSVALVYSSGANLYNALSQLLITSLDMSEAAADIIINGDNAAALKIKDNRLSSNEFERDTYLSIGTDATPEFNVFPTINTTSEKEAATFTVTSDTNTFGTDTSGATPVVRGSGTRGLELRGGSSGTFTKIVAKHGADEDVELHTTGTGDVVVGSGSGDATLRSNGSYNLTVGSGDSITLSPTGTGGDIVLNIDNTTAVSSATNGVSIPNDSHLNFGSTLGNGGYGIRANSNNIEIRTKASTGSWGTPYNSGMASATDGSTGLFISSSNLNQSSLSNNFYGIEAHGLGSVPRIVKAVLKCTTSNLGYAIDDEVDLSYLNAWDESSVDSQEAVALGYNDTNVFVSARNLHLLLLANKGGGGANWMNLSSWDIYVYAWK